MLHEVCRQAALFDEYARRSELKEVSADAVGISDVDRARQVASIAEEELRSMEAERRPLGSEAEDASLGD